MFQKKVKLKAKKNISTLPTLLDSPPTWLSVDGSSLFIHILACGHPTSPFLSNPLLIWHPTQSLSSKMPRT